MAERVAFVTGKLAEPSLRRVVGELAKGGRIDPLVVPLNIQVAALMTTEWVCRKLDLPAGEKVDRVVIPGYCRGDTGPIASKLGVPVEAGPRDLHDIPWMFGSKTGRRSEEPLNEYDIQIIAEINEAARLPMQTILEMAEGYRQDGADVIDIGCDPQAQREPWAGVGEVVRELRSRGMRVSVDTFQRREVELAVEAGAELVLSVNSGNAEAAADWGVEVVAIPDTPSDLESLDRTIQTLVRANVKFRLDPIIEPLGLGFSTSLMRYCEVRKRYPETEIMMGIGNLSEMTEVDSAGVNMMLIGICQEQKIRSVLTTQVINYARSSVREIDIARRMMFRAVARQTPPKHMGGKLVWLRDVRQQGFTAAELEEIKAGLTDRNIRIFIEPRTAEAKAAERPKAMHGEAQSVIPLEERKMPGVVHVMNHKFHLVGDDPFVLFDQMQIEDASHAFYLGYEMAKAMTALTLSKNYTQDVALRWGPMTVEEISHHERRKK